jgi:acetate kinase
MSAAERRIVVLNTGSSSLEFTAYKRTPEAPSLRSGTIDGSGGSSNTHAVSAAAPLALTPA